MLKYSWLLCSNATPPQSIRFSCVCVLLNCDFNPVYAFPVFVSCWIVISILCTLFLCLSFFFYYFFFFFDVLNFDCNPAYAFLCLCLVVWCWIVISILFVVVSRSDVLVWRWHRQGGDSQSRRQQQADPAPGSWKPFLWPNPGCRLSVPHRLEKAVGRNPTELPQAHECCNNFRLPVARNILTCRHAKWIDKCHQLSF